jgi:signal transduction histidine kinase
VTTAAALRPALARPRAALLGGVCAAVSRHLGWSLFRTRALAIALAVCGGSGILLYLWLWALVPLQADSDAVPTKRVPVAAVAGSVAAIAALSVVGGAAGGGPDSDSALGGGLLITLGAAGVGVAWNLAFDRIDPRRSPRYLLAWRLVPVAALAVAGAAVLSARPSAANAVLSVAMIVAGVAVIAAPRVVSLWTDLLTERATRVRQDQRAEIAAHLHDSVLQTLALIQNRAGASSEVGRIARAQERELREWLYADDRTRTDDLAAEIRELASDMELEHPVHFDVVAAGAAIDAPAALVAAVREAMLNAARHAGGEVSVYVESSAAVVNVFVRDRGPGLDLATLPADRLGIRESIIGRMSRAGGTATVRPGAGGSGTEVHLRMELS